MKTTLKIVGIIFLLLIVAAIALPFIFKGKLADLAREEINKSLNAKVGFGDISLSLIRSFPDFTLGIEELSVVGIDAFQDDTLAYIPKLDITVDLFSVVKGSTYEIKRISIIDPSVMVKILEDGTTNYDITKETADEGQDETTPEETGAYLLQLKDIRMTNGYIRYIDQSAGINTFLKGTTFDLSGDLTADETNLRVQLDVEGMDLDYGGIPYFSNTGVKYTADINADLKNEIYTLDKNSLSLNDLTLVFEGSVATVREDYNIVLSFSTPKTDFKTFLSLIPALYKKDFATLQASGKLGINGFIKGIYNEDNLPAFSLNLLVEDGEFRYPDLPQSVTDVALKAGISNSGGDADNTVIDLTTFHLKMGSNPVDMAMLIKTPVSDPDINGNVRGRIDLATVKEFYPLEADEELSGTVTADITLQGRLSAIENEEYESFTALGSLLLQNISYASSYTGQPFVISTAQLNFSPQYLDLVSFACTIGDNDLNAKGKISNYLGYALSDGTLTGNITTRSDFMDLNSLMESGDTEEEAAAGEQDTTALTVIEVPGNIDFEMNSSFSRLIYDTYEMENVNGRLAVRDKKLIIQNLGMNLLDGEMAMSGEYSTSDPDKPSFDFDLDIRDIDIQKAYTTFGVMEKYAPIAAKAKGSFSSKLSMRSLLDREMMPVYETMNGGGKLETSAIQIQGINTLDKIADAIKYPSLKDLSLDRILLTFEFVDGKILVEPFDINQKNFDAKVAGWTALDQTIDYTMNLNIPRASFGQEANNVLNNLVSQANSKGANFSLGETVSMDVLIGGTISNPEISTSLKETGKTMVEDVKKQVVEEIQKQKEELTKQAKEEAQKILDEANKKAAMIQEEARKQADNIRKNANDAAKKVRDEADKQAKNIEDEGKKKGFLAEAAAKESARQVRNEADRQANNLVTEADKQAKAVTDKADQEAARIKQEAQKEADRILGKI